jgi:hypothetical protein
VLKRRGGRGFETERGGEVLLSGDGEERGRIIEKEEEENTEEAHGGER